jgi:hypothetical protein
MIVLPALALAVTGLAVFKAAKKKKLTPEQLKIYRAALGEEPGTTGLKTSAQLRELSRAFRAQGFKEQADMLEKRAVIKDIPDEVKAQYRNIFRVALDSLDRAAVLKVANEFEKSGRTGVSNVLRNHAATLDLVSPKKRKSVSKKAPPAPVVEQEEKDEEEEAPSVPADRTDTTTLANLPSE